MDGYPQGKKNFKKIHIFSIDTPPLDVDNGNPLFIKRKAREDLYVRRGMPNDTNSKRNSVWLLAMEKAIKN